jgi:hypothetical protein
MDKSTWVNYQHEYGAGYYDPDYYTYSDAPPSPDSHFLYFDADGDGVDDLVVPTTEDASFGARFDPNLMVFQWDAFDPTSPNYLKKTPWVAAKNDPTEFFETPYSIMSTLEFRVVEIRAHLNLAIPGQTIKEFCPTANW